LEAKRPSKTPLIASVVLSVILGAGFGLTFVSSSQTEAALNASISSQQTVIGAQRTNISTLQASVSSLQANASAYRALVANLKALISTDTAMISSLNGKLTTANASIASLKSQIATAQAALANATNIIKLQDSKVLLSSTSVTIYGSTHKSSKPFVTFSPTYAGYVFISIPSSSESALVNSTAMPSNSNSGWAVFNQIFGLATSSPSVINYYVVPVSPWTQDTFALLSPAATDGTATVTATFYY
jgi:hypothetical protein